jgi:hypothetical protein
MLVHILELVEPVVVAVGGQKLFVGAVLYDPAPMEHDDPVDVPDGA